MKESSEDKGGEAGSRGRRRESESPEARRLLPSRAEAAEAALAPTDMQGQEPGAEDRTSRHASCSGLLEDSGASSAGATLGSFSSSVPVGACLLTPLHSSLMSPSQVYNRARCKDPWTGAQDPNFSSSPTATFCVDVGKLSALSVFSECRSSKEE